MTDTDFPLDDIEELLLLCREADFIDGVLTLLKRKQRNSEVAALYISLLQKPDEDASSIVKRTTQFVEWINTDPELTGDDWISILRYFANIRPDEPDRDDDVGEDLGVDLSDFRAAAPTKRPTLPPEVSQMIFSGDLSAFMRLLVSKALSARSLFSLIQELCRNDQILFEVVQHELNSELNRINQQLGREEDEHKRLLADLEAQIDSLETEDIEFKPFYCDECGQRLELPYVGFFCRHKVHRGCCKGADDVNIGCPLCKWEGSPVYAVPPEQKRPLELQQGNPDLLDSIVTVIQNGYFS
jgi:hypothetical protein